MAETAQGRIEQAQTNIRTLRQQLDRFIQTAEQQQTVLRRLQAAWQGRQSANLQEKALNEAVAYSMALNALGQQVDQLLPQLESSLTGLMTDLTAQVKEHQQLAALAKSAEVVNSTLDPSEVLNQVMDMLISLTGAERGFLMLLDEETGELEFKVARNLDRETIRGSSFEISRTIVNAVANEGEPVVTTNAQADPRFRAQESVVSYSLRSILCVPLKAKEKVTGVIYADNRIKTGLFTEADRDLLSTFANQAAVAIENARLFESVAMAKNLMDNVFASITSGVITTDRDDRITLLNPAAETILDVQAESCLDILYTQILPTLGETLPTLVENVKSTETAIVAHEMEPELPERGLVNLSLNLAPLKEANDETLGVAIVMDDLTEKKRFERERAMVKRYLPSELVDSLASLRELHLGGARAEVSIFFADIRGFTTYSEQHNPEQVVEAINTYYSLAHKAIRANRGIVDKYMGDAVMAHYNTPLQPHADHAWLAVRTAWQTRQLIEEYHQSVGAETRLEFGIGVNTGEAVAGNVGARDRMEYTLIGDAVNVAKRLQESAKPSQIILGQRTFELVKDRVVVNKLPPIQVRGRTAFEQVYELVELKA
ncbi:MAG: GAF domain-containing protein [Anaerolineae bacterium]|nr:MAG: GAF domain-containing protein [Anaerolineae bacterium]